MHSSLGGRSVIAVRQEGWQTKILLFIKFSKSYGCELLGTSRDILTDLLHVISIIVKHEVKNQ